MTVKERLLSILEQANGKELSGQELAERLGVSRQAVWKAMNGLKEDGFLIDAASSKGYVIRESGDFLSAEAVREHLPDSLKKIPVLVYDSVDSTNLCAKRLAADGAENGTLVIAKEQTEGRGRRGHSFYSPDKTGLYMSLLILPDRSFSDFSLYTVCAANAVCEAVEGLCKKEPQIKWVNDIFLDGKKICGILTEATADMESGGVDSVIIGIGVNITTDDFPGEITDVAGSIGGGTTRSRLAAAITAELHRELESPPEEIIERYKRRSLVLGKEVSFVRGEQRYTATAEDIAPNGELVVRLPDGTVMKLNSGEISVKINNRSV